MKTRILTLATLFLAAVSFLLPTPLARANTADTTIQLAAQPNALPGKAKAKYRARGGEQELQVELETARRLAGTTWLVAVDNEVVGQLTIDAFGKGRLSLNSRRGDIVPKIQAGTVVAIATLDGRIVFAGTL